jgi:hypothetical protein
MAQASINIQPVKEGSEQHNKREKYLDYVHPERTHLNEYWEKDTQTNRLAKIKAKYFETTGQKLQKRATPIREGCVNVEEWTTRADLEELAKRFHDRFGIYTFQFAIHKDEGYPNSKNGNKLNLHAHMVFDWTDPETGKTIKLNRQQMAEMQTITAEVLGMQRGVSSDKKHLTAMQYKEQKAREEAEKAIKAKAQAEQMAAAQTKAIALQSLLGGLAIHAAKVEQKRIENITNTLAEAGKKRLDEIAELKQEQEKTAKEVEKMRSTLSFERGRVGYQQKQLEALRSEISGLEDMKDGLNEDIDNQIAELNDKKSEAESLAKVVEAARSDIRGLENRKEFLNNEVLTLAQEKKQAEKDAEEARAKAKQAEAAAISGLVVGGTKKIGNLLGIGKEAKQLKELPQQLAIAKEEGRTEGKKEAISEVLKEAKLNFGDKEVTPSMIGRDWGTQYHEAKKWKLEAQRGDSLKDQRLKHFLSIPIIAKALEVLRSFVFHLFDGFTSDDKRILAQVLQGDASKAHTLRELGEAYGGVVGQGQYWSRWNEAERQMEEIANGNQEQKNQARTQGRGWHL